MMMITMATTIKMMNPYRILHLTLSRPRLAAREERCPWLSSRESRRCSRTASGDLRITCDDDGDDDFDDDFDDDGDDGEGNEDGMMIVLKN